MSSEPTAEASESNLSLSKVKLPTGDPCRDVLAPLALGLADGAAGLPWTKSISVSLVSETETRLYVASIAREEGSPIRYEIELDNDSASKCFLNGISANHEASLENDAKARVRSSELRVNAPVTVSPANDDCASTVKLLAQAAAVSAVGSQLQKATVEFEGATEDRYYAIHVDGKSFFANGQTFPNDADFELNVSNDSAFKCFVQEIHAK